jgi:hypothetical protein
VSALELALTAYVSKATGAKSSPCPCGASILHTFGQHERFEAFAARWACCRFSQRWTERLERVPWSLCESACASQR